jgi:hypothetical protein
MGKSLTVMRTFPDPLAYVAKRTISHWVRCGSNREKRYSQGAFSDNIIPNGGVASGGSLQSSSIRMTLLKSAGNRIHVFFGGGSEE